MVLRCETFDLKLCESKLWEVIIIIIIIIIIEFPNYYYYYYHYTLWIIIIIIIMRSDYYYRWLYEEAPRGWDQSWKYVKT